MIKWSLFFHCLSRTAPTPKPLTIKLFVSIFIKSLSLKLILVETVLFQFQQLSEQKRDKTPPFESNVWLPALSDWGDCFQAFAKRLIENTKIYNWLFQSSAAKCVFGANFCVCAIQIAQSFSWFLQTSQYQQSCILGNLKERSPRIETEIWTYLRIEHNA